MALFVLSFFPLDVLDEIWDLIESISEGFLTYFYICFNWKKTNNCNMQYVGQTGHTLKKLNDHLFGKELFIRFTVRVFLERLSILFVSFFLL